MEVAGRSVLLGDHTLVVKDGGRIPGVVALREMSETQSKPSYFRGQCWGAVGLLVGSWSACFCLPLNLQLHQGFRHLGEPAPDTPPVPTMGERIVQMAVDFARENARPAWLVLDAFFAVAPVFQLAHSAIHAATGQPLVHIITRAKKNYVGYFPPHPKSPGQRGRPRTYGNKQVLWEIFDEEYLFREVVLELYGKQETVQLMSGELLWKPTGQYLQFVWAVTPRGRIVLMCSDTELAPELVLELYSRRVRIETLFAVLKQTLGVFRFHFWSQYLPRHSRTPTRNADLKAPWPQHREKVKACWDAAEMFVLCGCIAAGLLQLFSLKYHDSLWAKHVLFLRTRSRELPSENTVRQILAPLLVRHLWHSRQNSMGWKIRRAIRGDERDYDASFAHST